MKRVSMYICATALSTAAIIDSQSDIILSVAVTTTTFAPAKLVAIGDLILPVWSFGAKVMLKRSASSFAEAWFRRKVRVETGIACMSSTTL